jgi:ATP/maltotriose-dependent transcriptional regulator MalT
VESRLPYVKALIDEVGIESLVKLEIEAVKVRPIPPKLIRDLERAQTLTGHEIRIIGLLAEGLSKPEIAHIVGSAPETIKTHMKNIHLKLGARSAGQTVARAIQAGYLRV